MRTLLPMIGGIIAIVVARRNDLGVLATFGLLFAGMAIGWGINRLMQRMTS